MDLAQAEAEEQQDEQTARLQQLRRDAELLDIENQLLEAYVAQAEQQGIITQSPSSCKKSKSTRRRKDSEARQDLLPRLTEDEKSDLVNQAVEALQDSIQQARTSGEKDMDDIRTLMAEVDVRMRETKQQTYEFKRDVILGAEDPRTGRTKADKVLRFFQDSVHDKEVLIDKLALKNTTFKASITKLEAQLAHKEEMGEVLHLVDFDQLKIENQQYLERIDAKNRDLLQLKLSTNKTVQLLNDVKGQLAQLTAEGCRLRAAIASRQRELDGFEADFRRTSSQSAQAAAGFRQLQAQQKDVEQPQILEYIRLKAQVAELQREAADWQRRLGVAHAQAAARGGGGSSSPGRDARLASACGVRSAGAAAAAARRP